MNWFIRGLFMPIDNRHYIGKRLHAWEYFFLYTLPGIIVALALLIMAPGIVTFLLFTGSIVFSLLDYFVFDRILDRLWWEIIFKRFYDHQPGLSSSEHNAIKALENHPSTENQQRAHKELIKLAL
jgi:hypothetical protein